MTTITLQIEAPPTGPVTVRCTGGAEHLQPGIYSDAALVARVMLASVMGTFVRGIPAQVAPIDQPTAQATP